jgi:hypothetical protein
MLLLLLLAHRPRPEHSLTCKRLLLEANIFAESSKVEGKDTDPLGKPINPLRPLFVEVRFGT